MSARRRAALAIVGLLCALVLLLAAIRLWPSLTFSLLQHGAQGEVRFWVKVVDQNQRGIAGYKCRVVEDYTSRWPFLPGKDVIRIFETDGNGFIEYTSRGQTSMVFFGMDLHSQWILNPRYLMQRQGLGVSSFQHETGVKERPLAYLGSKENPYLIRVCTVGTPQKLLYWKAQVKLKQMGDYLCVDLPTGRTWESKIPEGDVAMADGQYTKEGPPQCSVRLVAGENCSLYPVVDDWGLEPPEGGYVKELCRGKDWLDKRAGSFGPLQFYYRLGGKSGLPMRFGRLAFELHGPVDGATLLNYMNPAGERNLFYKGYTDLLDQKIQDFVSPPVQ